MSPRHFARVFRAETGVTPARFVEQARVEQARRRLEESSDGVEEIAARLRLRHRPRPCGARSCASLRVGPTDYRRASGRRTGRRSDRGGRAMGITTGILLFDGAEELDFVGPWEVFTMAPPARATAS